MANLLIKKNGYSRAFANAKLNNRRREADARQAKYDSLSLIEKIALAEGRPGASNRELARLHKTLAATQPENKPVKAPKAKVKKAKVPAT